MQTTSLLPPPPHPIQQHPPFPLLLFPLQCQQLSPAPLLCVVRHIRPVYADTVVHRCRLLYLQSHATSLHRRRHRHPHRWPSLGAISLPHPPQWYVACLSFLGIYSLYQNALAKRRLEDAHTDDDPHTKIRRVVQDHVTHDPAKIVPMTTVICLHAAVAQKSYGNEKRFLCPPPIVHIDGPMPRMRQQQLSMAVVSESGERTFEQKAPLDSAMSASFKFLHVAGSAKAKSFVLTLNIAEPPLYAAIAPTPDAPDVPTGRIWAAFDSAPVSIISKPSKKTAKTRNITSCILAGGPVSLFNRINSQTVRTKYMIIDHGQLCASSANWSAFNVNVVSKPNDPPPMGGPQPVLYGSEVILSDTQTGISTAALIIRKVEKGRVVLNDGGPVSQMQKIVLQRLNPDGSRHYLSAAGPHAGQLDASQTTGMHPLMFVAANVRDEVKDGAHTYSDEVTDFLCWTIVGISKFQYTFFDAFGNNSGVPKMPITPFPTLFTAPIYRPTSNSIELTIANFFYEDPVSREQCPLDVYLGSLGPLRHRAYQTTPAYQTLGSAASYLLPLAVVSDEGGTGYVPPGPVHTIVVVELPPIVDILQRQSSPPSTTESAAEGASPQSPSTTAASSKRQLPSPASIAGRNLPMLFIRPSDGVGYHSGRTITCDYMFPNVDLNALPPLGSGMYDQAWLAAAHAAATNPAQAWSLRVM
ncbi:hypothetical protein FISHEDRAFT_38917 [Fistulina hepatica ATCC 64428]|uniref:Beta-trefoil n=1 Tax=Fistulina hepatica ATCC 64428 TaxID=1128425 RepID=A0A0D7AJR5_9AGAR|nr:hypothetical protein FISHEDRAFT_38917 [Fistulina hepatica ATCC 64428]